MALLFIPERQLTKRPQQLHRALETWGAQPTAVSRSVSKTELSLCLFGGSNTNRAVSPVALFRISRRAAKLFAFSWRTMRRGVPWHVWR